MAEPPFDLLATGRIGVDIYPEQAGPLASVRTFEKSIGGTATNVAVACARLGRRVALVTKVGDDAFGDYVRAKLEGFGVDTRWVGTAPDLPTPVVFAELDPPEDPRLHFYRYPKAPDMELEPGDLDDDAVRTAHIFWVTGTALSEEPSRNAVLSALRTRERHGWTIFDLDWRPMFWRDPDFAGDLYREALAGVTVAIGNRDEVEVAVGTRDPSEAAGRLLELGVELAIVKQGGDGVLVATREGETVVPPKPVQVVCGLGAGDAFGGALCHRLLAGDGPPEAVRWANAAGAIVASRLLCADAMPTEAEIREMLGDAVTRTAGDLHLPAGSAAADGDPVVVTPARAGWRYCGLRVVRLAPGERRALSLGEAEAAVVPLSTVRLAAEVDGERFALRGRASVFEQVPDYLYAPRDATLTLTAPDGGDVAIATAPARTRRVARLLLAEGVGLEVRGSGRATRQVVNFLTPEVDAPDRLLCCEVLTPAGGWSSHPPHKHDDAALGGEAELEEIYYFRIQGDGGFGLHRTYDLVEGWDVSAAVRTDDVFLVPRGYHGPCAASPEHAMWYLNVLAGPGDVRSMAISDDPAHAWVRGSWREQVPDARVPMIRPATIRG